MTKRNPKLTKRNAKKLAATRGAVLKYFYRKGATFMTTGQKIYESRRKAGMTQEELADRLGVSRQAVSKWESDAAFPETEKILELCKLFSLSADELLLGQEPRAELPQEDAQEPAPTYGRIDHGKEFHFEYISKTKVLGMPLVHVNFGLGVYRAKGFFAIGNIATGLFSFGFLAIGLLAWGFLGLGLFAFGALAFALGAGAGAIATGALAFGGVAIGIMTFGGVSIGYFAVGGAAIGQYALGGWAQGFIAVGETHASGAHAFVVPEALDELFAFLDENAASFPAGLIKSVARSLCNGG